jgi:hypothetical protein
MKNVIAGLLLVAAVACAHTRQQPVSGWVSDAHCGAAHVGGKNPSCVQKCIKGGAHVGHPEWTPQAMVLVVDGSEQVLVIENPEVLVGKEAMHVTVEGKISGERIRVSRVRAS